MTSLHHSITKNWQASHPVNKTSMVPTYCSLLYYVFESKVMFRFCGHQDHRWNQKLCVVLWQKVEDLVPFVKKIIRMLNRKTGLSAFWKLPWWRHCNAKQQILIENTANPVYKPLPPPPPPNKRHPCIGPPKYWHPRSIHVKPHPRI